MAFIIGFLFAVFIMMVSRKNKSARMQADADEPGGTAIDQTVPDTAVGFGYKIMWFAVKTENSRRLAEILKLKNVSECNWAAGINKAYDGAVFITPPVDGWTLVCGIGLPPGDSKESVEEVKSILKALSLEFEDAQFFSSHRVSNFYCWMKASNGQVERVYSYGDDGNIVVEGQPTEFERSIALANTFSEEAKLDGYYEREDLVWPEEDIMMDVAYHWSVNPSTFDERKDLEPGLGLLGQR